MSMSPRAAADELRLTCDEARAHAEGLADGALQDLASRRQALGDAIARHLGVADRALSLVARRALLHDHRRLAQLLRAYELAADAGDVRAAATHARRLARFLLDHDARERGYV